MISRASNSAYHPLQHIKHIHYGQYSIFIIMHVSLLVGKCSDYVGLISYGLVVSRLYSVGLIPLSQRTALILRTLSMLIWLRCYNVHLS